MSWSKLSRKYSRPALRTVVALGLFGAILWGGSGRPPATLVFAGMGGIALLLALADDLERPLAVPPLGTALLLMAGLCLLQLVALPPSLQAALSPVGQRIVGQALAGLAPDGEWRPLTCDFAATLHQAARLAGLAAFSIALGRFDDTSSREWLRRLIVGVLVLFLVASLLTTAGALPHAFVSSLPTRALMRYSFVNPNHAASLLALVLPATVALLVRTTGIRRVALAASIVAGNLALAATLSRGGIAVGILGQLAVVSLEWRRLRSRERLTYAGVGLAVLGCAAAIAGVPLLARATEVATTESARLSALRNILPLLHDYWRTGIGRGAFLTVFDRYNESGGTARFAFVENEYVQILADFGLVAAVAILFVAVRALLRAYRAVRRPSLDARAAWVGLAALALHNVVDFSWEMSGIAAVAAVLIVLGFSAGRSQLLPIHGAALVLATLFLVVVAATPIGRLGEAEANRIEAASARPDATTAEIVDLARAAFIRHPTDGIIADLAARRLLNDGDLAAAPWIARALLVDPHDGSAHRMAARLAAMEGDLDLAARELWTAFRVDDKHRELIVDQALAIFWKEADGHRLLASLPRDVNVYFATLGRLLHLKRWDLLGEVGTAALVIDPREQRILRMLVLAGIERRGDPLLGERADLLAALDPSPETGVLVAEALTVAQRPADARRMLDAVLAKGANTGASIQLARLTLDASETDAARKILEDALARAIEVPKKAQLHRLLAEVEDRAGHPHRAARERTEAAQLLR